MPLITPNQLLEMLIAEVYKFDFQSYQQLLIRKAEITEKIRKKGKVRSLPQLQTKLIELRDTILPKQIATISYYTERIPRIKRIIEILNASRFRARTVKRTIFGFRVVNEDYGKILKLLQVLVEAENAGILSALKSQKQALQQLDYKKYLKHVDEEIAISNMLFKRISSFGISISQGIRDKGINPKISIPMKMSLLIALAILAISLSACSSSNDKRAEVRTIPESYLTTLKDCTYILQIDYKGDYSQLKDLSQVIRDYYDNDLKYEMEIEKQFEMETGLSLYGEYTVDDLTLARDFLLRTYGLQIGPMLYDPKLTILPPKAEIVGVSMQSNCPTKEVVMGLSKYGIIVTNSSRYDKMVFYTILAHEIAHEIHNKVNEKHPEFNKKWAMIKGGYALEYGMSDQFEDVATVVHTAIISFFQGMNLGQIKPIDGNYEAFHQKLRLLKEYGFFPEALKVP